MERENKETSYFINKYQDSFGRGRGRGKGGERRERRDDQRDYEERKYGTDRRGSEGRERQERSWGTGRERVGETERGERRYPESSGGEREPRRDIRREEREERHWGLERESHEEGRERYEERIQRWEAERRGERGERGRYNNNNSYNNNYNFGRNSTKRECNFGGKCYKLDDPYHCKQYSHPPLQRKLKREVSLFFFFLILHYSLVFYFITIKTIIQAC